MTDARGRDASGPPRAPPRPTAATPSSPPAARPSTTRASCGPTSRAPTTPRATTRGPGAALPDTGRGRPRSTVRSSSPRATRPSRRARFTEASLVKRLEELGRRPPVDLRLDHRHHPGPRLRVEEGLGPGAVLHRLRRRTLLESHFPDLVDYAFTARMEDDLDEIASGTEEQSLAEPLLLRRRDGERRRRRRRPPGAWSSSSLGDIDARAVNSIPLGADADGVDDRGPRRALRPVPPAGRGHRVASPRTCRPTSSPSSKAARAARGARATTGSLGDDPETGLTVLPGPAASGPTSSSASSSDEVERQAQDGVAVQDHDRRHAHARRGAAAAVAAPDRRRRPGRRRRDHRAERPLRARTSRRTRTPAASTDEDQLFTIDPRGRAAPCWPSPSAPGPGRRPSRR